MPRKAKQIRRDKITDYTPDELLDMFELNEEKGILTRKVYYARADLAKENCGTMDSRGYWQIRINGKLFLRSRIIFYIVNKYLPDFVDHINRIKTDDRPCNLRAATKTQNAMNRAANKGRLLPKRVCFRHQNKVKKYSAHIKVKSKQIFLGYFLTVDEAKEAYNKAARYYYGDFAYIND